MYLYPKVVRGGQNLGTLDVAARRTTMDLGVDEMLMLYIEEGEAKVAGNKQANTAISPWVYLYSIGPATSVTLEFDVEWVSHNNMWRPVTISEPWLIRAYGGHLYAQKGQTSSPLILDTGYITHVASVRGWYNLQRNWEDQGLIVAYIKDGEVWYRQYANQETGGKLWLDSKRFGTFTNVKDVSLYRTNDYRVGFVVVLDDGTIHNSVTPRNWAGAGSPIEKLSARVTDINVTMIPINYIYSENRSKASVDVDSIDVLFDRADGYNSINNLSNPDAFTITGYTTSELFTPDIADFSAVDESGRVFKVTSIQVSHSTEPSKGYAFTLSVEDFNNAIGVLTVQYSGTGATTDVNVAPYDVFSGSFLPTGLVPVEIDPPVVVSITNVEG